MLAESVSLSVNLLPLKLQELDVILGINFPVCTFCFYGLSNLEWTSYMPKESFFIQFYLRFKS